MSRRPAAALLVAASLALAAAPPAAADEIHRQQDMTFTEANGVLRVATSANVLDAGAYERLDDGLPSTVVIRVWLQPTGKQRVVAAVILRNQIVYDLWDEVYTVVTAGPSGKRTMQVKFKAEALKLLTGVDVALTGLDALDPAESYTVTVQAELNPISAQSLAEVRKWLSDGSSGGLDRGGSLFGSFVSVFVNPNLPAADRVLRLTSQPYRRSAP
ncbi:MAG TPA: hypothetical protein VHE35_22220 [Kofleriaceae bacterium]|nr:hypothetical protein [Kofleriaceae bacterium]